MIQVQCVLKSSSHLHAGTKWVGYLSALTYRSSSDARRTGGSNYIKDERSLIHYSLRLHLWAKNRNQVLWSCCTAARETFVPIAGFLSPLTTPKEPWLVEQMFLLILNQITLSSHGPEPSKDSLEDRRMKQKLIRLNKKKGLHHICSSLWPKGSWQQTNICDHDVSFKKRMKINLYFGT